MAPYFNVFDHAPLFYPPLDENSTRNVMDLLQSRITSLESDLQEMGDWTQKKLRHVVKIEMTYFPHTWIFRALERAEKPEDKHWVFEFKATARSLAEGPSSTSDEIVTNELMDTFKTLVDHMKKILTSLCNAYPEEAMEWQRRIAQNEDLYDQSSSDEC